MKHKLKPITIFTILIFLLTMSPVAALTQSISTAIFYYDSTTGGLHGSVYVHDPNQVTVEMQFSDGTSVTSSTYSSLGYGLFDDQNNQFKSVTFNVYANSKPTKIIVHNNTDSLDVTQSSTEPNNTQYKSSNDLTLDEYRIQGSQYVSTVTADTYIPANHDLFQFTPQRPPAGGWFDNVNMDFIEVDFPETSTQKAVINMNEVQASDFILRDVTVGQDVYVDPLTQPLALDLKTGAFSAYSNALILSPQSSLIPGHQYDLKMSPTSSGKEIKLPPAGTTYNESVSLGELGGSRFSSDNLYINLVRPINKMNFNNLTLANTQTQTTTSHPPVTTPPVNTEVNGPATITKEKGPDGKTITHVVLDGTKIGNAFGLLKNKDQGQQTVTINLKDTSDVNDIDLPGDALQNALKDTPNAILSIQSKEVGYDLPLNALNLDEIAKSLGGNLKDMHVHITMSKVSNNVQDQMKNIAKKAKINMVGTPYNFEVKITSKDKQLDVHHLNKYVSRTIILPDNVDTKNAFAVMYDPTSGEFSFVPAVFKVVDGKIEAIVKRRGNSIYSIVDAKKSFDDIQNHWAKNDIELLASKMLIHGVSSNQFAPSKQISRAEFSSLLVRALGLEKDNSNNHFTDVQSSDWFSGAVGAAVKAGLVNGFENGTFEPNHSITREEMAVMIARAIQFAGKSIDVSGSKKAEVLAPFTDKSLLNNWSSDAVAQSVEAGIMKGAKPNTLQPGDTATRAEAAVMLKRFLQYVQFIN